MLPISDKTLDYGREVERSRARHPSHPDESNERVQAKIKVAADEKIPMLIVGPRRGRTRRSAFVSAAWKDLGAMPLTKFVDDIVSEIEQNAVLG